MKLKKSPADEGGYLLIENLLTLSIITILLVTVYPLIADWFVLRNTARNQVEQARILYEVSMDWQEGNISTSDYHVSISKNHIQLYSDEIKMEVKIYEYQFD